MKFFDNLTERLYLWELKGTIQFWEKELREAKSRVSYATKCLNHYREELKEYHDQKTTG